MMLRLKAPRHATSFNPEPGLVYEVKDGHIVIPQHLKALAESHGYGNPVHVMDGEEAIRKETAELSTALTPEAVAAMSREELINYVENNRLELPSTGRVSDKQMREIVLAHATATLKIVKAAHESA